MYSSGPIPPEAGIIVTIGAGSKGPQFDWSLPIIPGFVTLQQVGALAIVTESRTEHPLASVTVTEYVPGINAVAV